MPSLLTESWQVMTLALQVAAAVTLRSYFKANLQNVSILAYMVCKLRYGHDCGLNESCKVSSSYKVWSLQHSLHELMN